MSHPDSSVDDAVERAVELASAGPRAVLGIAGAPGAGKSTLARRVVAAVDERLGDGTAVQVPMDGFHLSNAALDALGRHDRKGAVDTFDADGYVALVRRLVAADSTVWAPDFDRRIDEPVAGSIAVPPTARLVVSEGTTCSTTPNRGQGSATCSPRPGSAPSTTGCGSTAWSVGTCVTDATTTRRARGRWRSTA